MKTPDEIKRSLSRLRDEIRCSSLACRKERDDEVEREGWRGADVIVTADFESRPGCWLDEHKLWIRTRHARPLGWLFREIRDAFHGWYDFRNKYGFFGSLGQAALKSLARSQPEPDDHRPLLLAVLQQADAWAEFVSRHDRLPDNAPVVIHLTDVEGRQLRLDASTGEETV